MTWFGNFLSCMFFLKSCFVCKDLNNIRFDLILYRFGFIRSSLFGWILFGLISPGLGLSSILRPNVHTWLHIQYINVALLLLFQCLVA